MKSLRALLRLDQVSVLILVLPYVAFSISLFRESPFFSFPKFLLTLSIFLFLDVAVKLFLKRFKGASLWVSLLLYSGILLLFYSPFLLIPVQNFIEDHFSGTLIRGRVLFVILSLLILLFVFLTRKKNSSFNYFINAFMLILFVVSLSGSILKSRKHPVVPAKDLSGIRFDIRDSVLKPVILIITDEYSSPDELYTLFPDSSIYDFSNGLKQAGWVVRNRSYSYETSTIHSMSSMFNFNLSEGKEYRKASLTTTSMNMLYSRLGDSLERKNIDIINFGIFDINKSRPFSRLYPYPKSYSEVLFYNSALTIINQNTGSMNQDGFKENFIAMASHNKRIFEGLTDSLQRLSANNHFVYVHLLMPHSPFVYYDEINKPRSTANYLAYWRFANRKVQGLLDKLLQSNKYRIIVTGDHGYRGEPKINAQYTATAFWGFRAEDIEQTKSVQDLGILINGYLR